MAHRVQISVDVNTQQAVQSVSELSEALQRLSTQAGSYGGSGGSGARTGGTTTSSAGRSGYPYAQERVEFYGQRAFSFGLLMAGYSMKQFASYLDQLNSAVMSGATKFGEAMTRIVGVTNMSSSQSNVLSNKILNQNNLVPAAQAIQGVYPFATRNYPMKYAPEVAKATGVLSFMTGTDAQTIGNLLATALEQSTRNMSYTERRQNFSTDFKQLLDLLTYSWSKSPIEPQSVMKAATYAMPAMLTGGLNVNEAYALFATMLGAMPEGGRVGRYARTSLTNMVTMSPAQETKLQELTGLTAQQLDWTKGLSTALNNIASALSKQPQAVQMEAAKQIFGLRGLSSGLDLIKNLQELSMYVKTFNPKNVQGSFQTMETKVEQTPYGQYVKSASDLSNSLTKLKGTFEGYNTAMNVWKRKMADLFDKMPKYAKYATLFGGGIANIVGDLTSFAASLMLIRSSFAFLKTTGELGSLGKLFSSAGLSATVGQAFGASKVSTVGAIAGTAFTGYTIGQTIANALLIPMQNSYYNTHFQPYVLQSSGQVQQAASQATNQDMISTTKTWLETLTSALKQGKETNNLFYEKKGNEPYLVFSNKGGQGETSLKLDGKSIDETAKAIASYMQSGRIMINMNSLKGDTYRMSQELKKVSQHTADSAKALHDIVGQKGTSDLDKMLSKYMSDNRLSFSEVAKIQAEMTKEGKSNFLFAPQDLLPSYKPLSTSKVPSTIDMNKVNQAQPQPTSTFGTHEITVDFKSTSSKLSAASDSLFNAANKLSTTQPAIALTSVGGF